MKRLIKLNEKEGRRKYLTNHLHVYLVGEMKTQ